MDTETSSRIVGIQFSMLSPEEIRKNSVVEITSKDTYVNNKPVIHGLFDPRMGVLEAGLICPTDGLTYIETPGYFGHIELARPVFFIQHLKEIEKICKCVCYKCSKLLMNKDNHAHIMTRPPEARWKYVYDYCSSIKRCGNDNVDGCGYKQPTKINLEQFSTLVAIWENVEVEGAGADGGSESRKETITTRLTPELLQKIFRRISNDDVLFMGFHPKWSRPEWMICSVLPVPPPAMRPSVKHDAQQRSEDDLTTIYSNIIKTNIDLKKKIGEGAEIHVIDGLTLILQFYVAMVANNKVKGSFPMAQRSGRPLQCIMGRINSKNGRIRGNLMGKRVNFSARSVITGDPNLSIRQLGVPLKIAMNLTKPVRVNARNIDALTHLVRNGPDVFPGAKTLERRGERDPISLRNLDTTNVVLHEGDLVHRHLMDGDYVLFNRQPSLHRMSMMGHVVKIMMVGDTFRMNVGVTKCFNADFDGDEMNMHVPQNIVAEVELARLAAIPYQIISPANNSPIIGIFQDSLLGAYRFTRQKLLFTPPNAMKLLAMFPDIDVAALRASMANNGGYISNFDILSQIMPPMSIKFETKLFQSGEEDPATSNNVLEIRNGQYIRGQIDKGVVNGGTKGLIHRIYNVFGPDITNRFIDNFQNIITEYMKTASYSVGINDLVASKTTYESIAHIIDKKKDEVDEHLSRVHLGIFKNITANSNLVQFESEVKQLLDAARKESETEANKSLNKNNRFLQIVSSGSKGSILNIIQMISCLGQQDFDGKRIPYGFDSRTLPHFNKFDDSAQARGFVENSYISGLTSHELFFHAMAGRIGLIDTAVKSVTRETTILIVKNGEPIYTAIGDWIDAHLDSDHYSDYVKHFPSNKNMELLDLISGSTFISTVDADGRVTWGEVTAMTRHDPGERLYEILTQSGRKVTVAESQSLLVWDSEAGQVLPKNSPDVHVGDCVPVTVKMSPATEYLYDGNEDEEQVARSAGILLAYGAMRLIEDCAHDPELSEKYSFSQFDVAALWPEAKVCKFLGAFFHKFSPWNHTHPVRGIYIPTPNKHFRNLVSMLLNRLGIFCEFQTISYTGYLFYSEYIHLSLELTNQLAAAINLDLMFQDLNDQTDEDKTDNTVFQDAVEQQTTQNNYSVLRDVVLDPIIHIQVLGTNDHPKLYDITVPSTLNFGLANGLMVRDTSQTGYIQRRLIKGLEDLKVEYDMTVRNSMGKIVQFRYGDDGFDSSRVESQSVPIVSKSIEDIYNHYNVLGLNKVKSKDKAENLLAVYTKDAAKRFKSQVDALRPVCKKWTDYMLLKRDEIVKRIFQFKNESNVNTPIGFSNHIANIQGQLALLPDSAVDITPFETFELLDETFARISSMMYSPPTELFKVLYYYYLSPKELLDKKRFNKKAVLLLLDTIYLKYRQALVDPGEMVGVIAGQSVGEPTTQLTLNTFHLSGVASKSNVTRGVPRIEEILRLTDNPKNPSMTVYLREIDHTSQEKASYFATLLSHTRLVDVVKGMQICFDPRDSVSNIKEDSLLIERFYEFERQILQTATNEDGAATAQGASKWIIRMEMDREKMFDKNITMDDIHFAIKNSYSEDDIHCIYSDFNMQKLVFRLRVKNSVFRKGGNKRGAANSLDKSDDIYLLKNFQDSLLNNIVLRGLPGVDNVIPRKLSNIVEKKDGKFQDKKDVWILDTTGSNLLETLALDFIDAYNTFSNDIKEVFDVLGIEAARRVIYNEFYDVMEFSGVYINYHHLSLLCDRMTSNKCMVAIFRSGILKDNIGPIAKATFEVHTEVLLDASRHAQFDTMRGVSANVMCGQYGLFGTNAFNVLLDMDKLQDMKQFVKEDRAADIERELSAASTAEEGVCAMDHIRISGDIRGIRPFNGGELLSDDVEYNVGF